MKVLNEHQKSVLVQRQLADESSLVCRLTEICTRFGEIVQTSHIRSVDGQQMSELQQRLASFAKQSEVVKQRRQRLLEIINQRHADDSKLTVRQFIQQPTTPNRAQLEAKRQEIISQMQQVKNALNGDSAIVFYSFDFFRRMVNGILDGNLDQQAYGPNGSTSEVKPGQIYKKAC